MRALAIVCVGILALITASVVLLAGRYGGGERFPDLTTDPALPATSLEVVANLDSPPGNNAVSASGRVLFSFHPEASPRVQVAEIVFGPDGWLYVTCSALHHVIMRSADHIRTRAPYQIFRFRPGFEGVPGQ